MVMEKNTRVNEIQPPVKVVTERSLLPKNLESKLQKAWLSKVSNPKVKPLPATAVSHSENSFSNDMNEEIRKSANGALKRTRSDKSAQLVSSLESLYKRTFSGKRKGVTAPYPESEMESLDENFPHHDEGTNQANLSILADSDYLRMELEASHYENFPDGILSEQAVEEEFYKGIDNLQDALDNMEFHLPSNLELLPEDLQQELASQSNFDHPEINDDFFGQFLDQTGSRTASILSGGSNSSRGTATRLEQEELIASEYLQKLERKCDQKKSQSAHNPEQCEREKRPVEIMIDLARSIVAGDRENSKLLLKNLSQVASVYGSMTQRISAYFLKGFSEKLAKEQPEMDQAEWNVGTPTNELEIFPDQSSVTDERDENKNITSLMESFEVVVNSSPFLTFGQVAANSAILELCRSERAIHIVDFGIGLGLQWPALIQAMAVRKGGGPRLTITGIEDRQGDDGKEPKFCLRSIEEKLTSIARAWGLEFKFRLLNCRMEAVSRELIECREDEAVVAICPLRLRHKFREDSVCDKSALAGTIRGLAPKLSIVVEETKNRSSPYFLARFYEALFYYLTLFESLDKSVTGVDAAKKQVFEEQFLEKGIVDAIAGKGQDAGDQDFVPNLDWKAQMTNVGFRPSPVSEGTVTTVKALLQTYRAGYGLLQNDGSLTLTWDDSPLLVMSCWETV